MSFVGIPTVHICIFEQYLNSTAFFKQSEIRKAMQVVIRIICTTTNYYAKQE